VAAVARALTQSNLVQMVENQQYRLSKQQQRDFPSQLIAASWQLFSNPGNVVAFAHQLGAVLQSKHLQLWSSDPSLEAYLAQLGWAGGLLPHRTGDFLYETDNKLLSNKVDYYTHTSITYDVTILASGAIRSTCAVRLVNDTPPGQSPPITGEEAGADNNALI